MFICFLKFLCFRVICCVVYDSRGIGDSCTLDDDNWNMIADNWNWEELYDDNWNMRAAASVIMICMALVDLRFFKNYKTVEGASTGS